MRKRFQRWFVIAVAAFGLGAGLLSCGKLDGFAVGELVSLTGDVQ